MKSADSTPWYKVPVMWLVIAILLFTVISAFSLMGLAHNTQDALVIEQGAVPLNKKQALPENAKPSNKQVDKTDKSDSH